MRGPAGGGAAGGGGAVTGLPVEVCRDLRKLVVRPAGSGGRRLPGLLWIHGGGYVGGLPEHGQDFLEEMAHRLGAVIVSPDYRLAPENPYPAALNDCRDVLDWMHRHVDDVDSSQLLIGGNSAGAGLAAALALINRDQDHVPVLGQMLIYPMLDDRTVLRPADPWTGRYVWTPEQNAFGWRSVLGPDWPPGDPAIPAYAAPARATDLSGLPRAFVATGTLDLFLDENVDYARRLMRAGVPTGLHVEPGAVHGYLGMPGTRLGRKLRRTVTDTMAEWLSGR
ncbi:alpha/beta hydrolase [Actinoplanes couchii]|nr:alpha/beta hydrolase [Actinoplanes couchii]